MKPDISCLIDVILERHFVSKEMRDSARPAMVALARALLLQVVINQLVEVAYTAERKD